MRRDNPNDSPIPGILRRIHVLETQSPIGFSSITRGRLRVASNEGLLVQGSEKVEGWLVVTGTLKGTGTFDWSGTMNLSGAQHVTGPVTFDATLDINGDATLQSNLTLTGAGEIHAGNIVIDPSAAGGQISFGGGRTIDAGSGYLAIRDGSRFVVFNSSGIAIDAGGPTISVTSGGLTISGLPTRVSSLADGAAPGTIWLDGSNRAYKIIHG